MKRPMLMLLGLIGTTAAAPTFAQDELESLEDDFLYEDEPVRTWLATIELGLLLTSGNTEKESLKGRLDATQDLAKWRNTYNLEAFSSNDRDKATAERYRASAKSDYKLLNDAVICAADWPVLTIVSAVTATSSLPPSVMALGLGSEA